MVKTMFKQRYAYFARDYKGEYRERRRKTRHDPLKLSQGKDSSYISVLLTVLKRGNQYGESGKQVREAQILKSPSSNIIPDNEQSPRSRGYSGSSLNENNGYLWQNSPELRAEIGRNNNALYLAEKLKTHLQNKLTAYRENAPTRQNRLDSSRRMAKKETEINTRVNARNAYNSARQDINTQEGRRIAREAKRRLKMLELEGSAKLERITRNRTKRLNRPKANTPPAPQTTTKIPLASNLPKKTLSMTNKGLLGLGGTTLLGMGYLGYRHYKNNKILKRS